MSLRQFLQRQPRRFFAALAILLAAAAISVDFSTWIELNVSIMYGLPLFIAAAGRSRRLLWLMAAVFVCATFIVYSMQIPAGRFSIHEQYFLDRVLAAANVVLITVLLHALSRAADVLEARNVQLAAYQREITQRNQQLDRQRLEAEEASDRKTRLLTSISHDIRTPLTTINVVADLIRDAAEKPDLLAKLPSLARNIQSDARSLASMVTDVLDISYFDSGRIELRETEFSLNDLLAEECRSLEPLAAAKGLTLAGEAALPAVWLRADRVKLARVLRNLVNNAIQFTDRGGVAVTSAPTPEGGVSIRVADTGIGISPERLAYIFGEFKHLRDPQPSDARSGDSRGWGLGLAICKRLTGLMGGDVSVESELKHGSVFTIRLPPSRVALRTSA